MLFQDQQIHKHVLLGEIMVSVDPDPPIPTSSLNKNERLFRLYISQLQLFCDFILHIVTK